MPINGRGSVRPPGAVPLKSHLIIAHSQSQCFGNCFLFLVADFRHLRTSIGLKVQGAIELSHLRHITSHPKSGDRTGKASNKNCLSRRLPITNVGVPLDENHATCAMGQLTREPLNREASHVCVEEQSRVQGISSSIIFRCADCCAHRRHNIMNGSHPLSSST